ncbi:MAG: type II toxin-antitoxin system Phd/YefM family antitoxin [Clostridiales Family XIII bacterium]|jgi:prevent-host-death family protein|nr:type II toxin-antitoxin system Phd/YefM family antitoxin [Clostridiales Family XIII bacterium]
MNINIAKDIRPISYIKSHAAEMLEYVNTHKSPIVVTQHGEAKGVLLDAQSYQELMDSIAMMKLMQIGEKQIREGKIHTTEEVFAEIDAMIEAM